VPQPRATRLPLFEPSLLATYAERICHSVDVVEPSGDEGDLQDASIIETGSPQIVHIVSPDLGRIFCDLHDVIEHHAVLGGDGRFRVVLFERLDQSRIERNPAQKLCVGLDSIDAPVGH